ncbi:MAG: type VI secretion system contractile sheath small subunit, partial [Pirellulaceae bacterium]|nr:type VI secretion system contractile sheath small subunit [Pirellulaceae bacterium]
MNYEVSFGKPVDEERMVKLGDENVFRIAVLGDFSGRANSGEVAIGDELAARKAHRVDVDNLDDVMARFEIKLSLPIANNEGIVNLELSSIDDFHPDQLYERLPVFEKLISLRSKLQDPSSFAKSSAAVKSLLGQHAVDRHANLVKKSGSNSVPNRKINEFESLISDSKAEIEETPVVDLLKRVVGSFVIDAPDPAQDQLVATVDEALSDTMRRLLHHP